MSRHFHNAETGNKMLINFLNFEYCFQYSLKCLLNTTSCKVEIKTNVNNVIMS